MKSTPYWLLARGLAGRRLPIATAFRHVRGRPANQPTNQPTSQPTSQHASQRPPEGEDPRTSQES
eukprot:11962832-Alexandrium_andersonii.AAC.1